MSSDAQVVVDVRGLTKRYELGELASLGRTKDALKAAITRRPRDHDHFLALDDVSFEVRRGDCLGIVGENGSGKSTLLSIIAEMTVPSGGEVDVRGRVGPILATGSAFHPELTGRENVELLATMLGLERAEIDDAMPGVAAFASLSKGQMATPVKRYSRGMLARLSFATVLRLPNDIYLFDEVLAEADDHFKAACLEEIRRIGAQGGTVLFTSHELPLVRAVCSHGLWLVKGRVQAFGPIDGVAEQYAEFEARREAA